MVKYAASLLKLHNYLCSCPYQDLNNVIPFYNTEKSERRMQMEVKKLNKINKILKYQTF